MQGNRDKLNIAEKFIVDRAEEYPILYPLSRKVFISGILGNCGEYTWKDGILIPNKYDDHKCVYKMHDDILNRFFLNKGLYFTIKISTTFKDAPIYNMPDDMHDDWQSYIFRELYSLQKITPEMYKKLTIAYCIMEYHCEHNPRANHERNNEDYYKFYQMIPSFMARLTAIRDTQHLGMIPAYKYTGMNI